MRLICSSCGAVYKVPDTAIPPEGREVQCTNCGHGWFHKTPEATEGPEPGTPPAAGSSPRTEPAPEDGSAPRRPPVDPKVRQVLREEADREIEARRRERAGPRPAEPVREAPPTQEPAARRASSARIEPPTATAAGLSPAAGAVPPDRRASRRRTGGGFVTGFVLTLVAVGALAAAYVYDEAVVEAAPAAAEPMAGYVAAVDDARVAVNGATRSLVERIEALLPDGPPAEG